jgi:NitT/TauT family transport system substrate-binding protein
VPVTKLAVAIIITVVLIAAGGFFIGAFPSSEKPVLGSPDSIVIGIEPNQANLLIYIADEKGYFTENDLNITLKNYSSGAAAVDGMVSGEVDIATATEFVLVNQVFAGNNVSTIASIDKFEQIYLISRIDRGIRSVSDLKGKKIGLPLKTNTEFILGRYLNLNGMEMQDVMVSDIKAQHMAGTLANGTVDAVVVWQPYVSAIRDQMENDILIWPAQSGQAVYCNALTTGRWLSGHSPSIKRFLDALARAESDVTGDPAAAKDIMEKRLGYERAYIDAIWPEHHYSLSLDQSLVTAMEDEARWKMENHLTDITTMPDFRYTIYRDGLETVKPGSVYIIG